MTVAFGTSTPTSITVVATSTSTSPALNASKIEAFSAGGEASVQEGEPQPFELAGLQALEGLGR